MRKFVFISTLFFLLFDGAVFSFAGDKKNEWLEKSKIGLKIEMGAHILFQRDFEGFIANENGLFLYAASLQPEIYEELIRPLKLVTDKKKIDSVVGILKKTSNLPYVILPAKNYDGFCFWDSAVCDYNIKDHTDTKADWLRLAVDSLKEQNIRVGFSYSIIDWHHPSQIQYKKDGSRYAVKMNTVMNEGAKESYIGYMTEQLKELVIGYGADMIYFDGDWAPWWTPEDAEALLEKLYEWNPDLIVNNYLGDRKKHRWGDFDVYKTVIPSKSAVQKRNRPWVFSMNTFTGVDQINNNVLYKQIGDFIGKIISVWEEGGSILISLDVMNDAIVSEESMKLAAGSGEWFRINGEIFKDTQIVSDGKIAYPDTVSFYAQDRVYCLQKQNGLWIAEDKPYRLKLPSSFPDTVVKEAWLLTGEGKIPLIPVSGKDGNTTCLELNPRYRDVYLSLMMPVYGFEY